MPQTPAPIDDELAAFIAGSVSMQIGCAGLRHDPSVVRALGCRLSADRRQLSLVLDRARAAPVIERLRINPAVAVVFSQPSTHRTVQFKGTDATIESGDEADALLAAQYRERMIDELAHVGMSAEFTRAFLSCNPAALVRLRFTPTVAFSQSPGPDAGAPLVPAS